VIWFSGSFPLDIEPNPSEEDPNDSVERFDEWLRETDNLLTRAQVAVYRWMSAGCRRTLRRTFYDDQEMLRTLLLPSVPRPPPPKLRLSCSRRRLST